MVDPVVTPLVIGAATWLGGALTSQAGESVALSLATNLGTSQLLDPVCRRIRGAMGARMAGTDGSLPRNHDVERAVRTAQMQANRALVAEFGARAAGRNAPSDVAFAKKCGAWIEDQYAAVGRLEVSDAVRDAMVAAIDASLIDRAHVAGDETLRDEAAAATQAALAEMETAVGPVPEAFRARFLSTDPDEKPWFDAFGAFLAEQVKKNADFRAILTAANLTEIGAGVQRIEEMADEWAIVADDLRAKAEEGLERLEKIETKVDQVQTKVDQILAELVAQRGASAADVEALRAERDHLKAQGEIKDKAFEGFLRDLGQQPIPPEQWATQLATFAERYQTLLSESRARTNLPADLEEERLRAESAIEAGDLDAAETILAELSDRMAANRVQAGREEAAIRARRAEIAKTRLRYRDAADLFGQAAELEPADDQEAVWRRLLEQAGALYDQCNEFGDNEAGLKAIGVYRNSLAAAPRGQVPLDWAHTQNNLGSALATLGQRESGTARLEEAVEAFRATLTEYTRERVPRAWAMTQNNLGNALQTLGQRESGTSRLEEAVGAYRSTLTVYTRECSPLLWATTLNNLGNALTVLGQRENRTARLEEAVLAYDAALAELTREDVPLDWAMIQNNLGNALQALGQRESGTARLTAAVEAYRAALMERTRERVPLDWAMTQNNLGNALAALGSRERGTLRLEEAVEAYRAALTEHTRERVPLGWAMTQNNLGSALQALGQREHGTARLEEAVQANLAALTEYTRESGPLQWAATQNNMGNALQVLGEREGDNARLEESIQSFRAALLERTRERVPLDWAMTQNNLGNALAILGERESETVQLEQAVEAYRAALNEYTRERMPLQWAMTMENLALVQETLFDRTGHFARLNEALVDARATLEVYEAAGADHYVEKGRRLVARLEAKRAALP